MEEIKVAKILNWRGEVEQKLAEYEVEVVIDFDRNYVINTQDAEEILDIWEYEFILWKPSTPGIGAPRPRRPRS